MCGAFTLTKPIEDVASALGVKYDGPKLPLRFNARPSQFLPAILNTKPKEIVLARWGFEPNWQGRDVINARQETLSERPMFKEAFEQQRCLVPADGFYEWGKADKKKWPHLYILKNKQLFNFAGLWRTHKDNDGKVINEFVIITTKANELVAKIHDRMPVIIIPGMEEYWLSEYDENKIFRQLDARHLSEIVLNNRLVGP